MFWFYDFLKEQLKSSCKRGSASGVLLHRPKHCPVTHDLVLLPARACQLPFSPYVRPCDQPYTPAMVVYAEQASFSSHTNPLPLLQDGAGPTSPAHPPPLRASAATPTLSVREWCCSRGSTSPHGESVGSHFAQSVFLGRAPKRGS